ncbi:hypothetical protein PP178_04145 [Zeaxanthinibacter sp. PT1]|uniref:hypothetical protein n=1 Tax=Zeaxanthinibacter TaxID=561554 RepID=UPI00234C033D|nr:hypothetical protein [Zeaxanthinibacter sp. PT1]MDC6350732.1 hypothetical protein [Zeaxanthinibacter sp. PT1]
MEKVENQEAMTKSQRTAVRKNYLQNYVDRLKSLLAQNKVDSEKLTLEEEIRIRAEIKSMEAHIANHIGSPLFTETRIDSIMNLKIEENEQSIPNIERSTLGPLERACIQRAHQKQQR